MGRCLFEAGDQIDVLCIDKFGQKQEFFKWRVRTMWLDEQMYGGRLFEAGDQIDVLFINKFGQKQVFLNWRVRTR
jgi:hypothetical protein